MRVRLARLLLVVATLLLPLQVSAGIAMQIGGGQAQPAQTEAAYDGEATEHCPLHETASTAPEHADDAVCDDCGVCHLACAGYLPTVKPLETALPAGRSFVLPVIAAPDSHISEPPQQPPRRLN